MYSTFLPRSIYNFRRHFATPEICFSGKMMLYFLPTGVPCSPGNVSGDRSTMKTRKVCIRNSAGIHCRPSGVILRAIQQEFPFHSFTVTTRDGEVAVLDSILSLISLGLCKGEEATLSVEGPEEDKAVERIGDLFEFEFDFPPRK